MRTARDTNVEVGDLVNHILMDEEWLGIVVSTKDFSLGDEIVRKAYVHLTSSHVFSKWHSTNPSGQEMVSGWVDIDFLRVISKRADKE